MSSSSARSPGLKDCANKLSPVSRASVSGTESAGGLTVESSIKVQRFVMKLEILRSAEAVTQKIMMDLPVGVIYLGRVEQQIKVGFYLVCLVCLLSLFFQKNVLESNNAQAANTKIKLHYSTSWSHNFNTKLTCYQPV